MSITDDIKARLDIVQFVSQYVPLKKAGRNYIAPCPFHTERTPSFVVFPETQGWHCFGACGEGGDIFNFVMKKEGLDFVSALRLLAEKAGIELQERSPEQAQQNEYADKLRGLLDVAARFFHQKLLRGPQGQQARAYVQQRGLEPETLDRFVIGYAPGGWQDALDHLRLIGYSIEEVIDAGLAIRNDSGRVYDRFRNRLMIPISDERGRVIGFGARALDPEDNPKYLNSPQTELFDKSATLFGLHLARRAIRESETAVIVEGYMDAIQAHQAGFTNVVAQMGTALTRIQLKALSKYARRLILALDPDAAGMKATMRGLDVVRQASEAGQVFFDPGAMLRQASRMDIDMQVVALPEGHDPDDLIRENPQAWQTLIDSAQPVADYVISVGTAHITPSTSLAERERVARELLPILMATESSLQEYANFQKLAYKLRLGSGRELAAWAQRHIRAEQPRLRAGEAPVEDAPPSGSAAAAPGVILERECLARLVRSPEMLPAINRRFRALAARFPQAQAALGPLSIEDFGQADHRAIFDTLQRALDQDEMEIIDYVLAHLPHALHQQVGQFSTEPLTDFEQRLDQALRADLRGVVRPLAPEEQLERRALALRKLRLRAENTDLQLLQQEADPGTDRMCASRIRINRTAISLIDVEIRETGRTPVRE